MSWPLLLSVVPFALALLAAVAAIVADGFSTRRVAVWTAGCLLAAGSIAAFVGAWTLQPRILLDVFSLGGAFSGSAAVALLAGALSIAGGAAFLEDASNGGSLVVLIALASLTAAVTCAAADVLAMFIALEATALAGYALVAGARSTRGDQAAMKYFVQGAVAASLFILGIAGVLAISGGTSLLRLGEAATLGTLPLLGGVTLVGVALAFKTGAFPFHAWVPDAYEAAPPQSAAFLAGGPKIAAISALSLFAAAIGGPLHATGVAWAGVMACIAVASIVFGNLAALRQRSYTRMLAYSGIAQAGYALVAVTVFARTAAVIMIATYAIAAAAAFLAADAARRCRPHWDGSIKGLGGLARSEPLFSGALAVAMLSLTGVPPLLGFWGKFQAFGAAVFTGNWWLAAVGMIGSVVSFGYYGAVLRAVYFEDAPDQAAESRRPGSAGIVVVAIACALIVLGALPLAFGSGWLTRLFGF